MKIIVFGACGRTGKLVVAEAQKRGFDAVGVDRQICENPQTKMYLFDRRQDILNELIGCDAVISVIGHTTLREKNTQTDAISEVIEMMKKTNVKRLVSLTGSGVRVEGDKVSIFDRILNIPLKIIDSSRIEDGVEHYKLIKNSDLDWTVLRVLKLSNANNVDDYQLTQNGPAKKLVSRRTVASVLLELATSNEWLHRAPVISAK